MLREDIRYRHRRLATTTPHCDIRLDCVVVQMAFFKTAFATEYIMSRLLTSKKLRSGVHSLQQFSSLSEGHSPIISRGRWIMKSEASLSYIHRMHSPVVETFVAASLSQRYGSAIKTTSSKRLLFLLLFFKELGFRVSDSLSYGSQNTSTLVIESISHVWDRAGWSMFFNEHITRRIHRILANWLRAILCE